MNEVIRKERMLTAPGAPFELGSVVMGGIVQHIFTHAPSSLLELLERAAKRAEQEFLIDRQRRLTNREFFEAVRCLAVGLKSKLGVVAGSRVAIAVKSAIEAGVAFSAVISLGGIAVLIGEMECYDIEQSCHYAKCQVLISERAGMVVFTGLFEEKEFAWQDLLETQSLVDRVNIAPEDLAVIAFTSGTSGRPKGVELSHRNIVSGLMNAMLAGNLSQVGARPGEFRRPSNRLEGPPAIALLSPFSHISGFTQLLLQLLLGGKIVLVGADVPAEQLSRIVAGEKVRSIVGLEANTLFQLLRGSSVAELSSISSVFLSGSALQMRTMKRVEQRFPNAVVTTSYGMTETCGTICALAGDVLKTRPQSSGRVVPSVEVKIVRSDGVTLEAGQIGRVLVRGAMLFRGYCREQKPSVLEGWFDTGDLGCLGEDRYLTVMGRAKDVISINERLVSPISIERAIMEAHEVDDVAVAKIGDGDELVALIVPSRDLSVNWEQLASVARNAIGSNLHCIEVAEIPRNRAGKLDANRLQDIAESF